MMRQTTITIPAKNEEEHIGECLAALCAQTVMADAVLLYLNNCTDRTAGICRNYSKLLPLIIIEDILPAALASAGEARRRALVHVAYRFPHAAILTADADSRPPPEWVELNLRAIENGADAVCGYPALFSEDAPHILPELQQDNRRETLLLALLDEIDAFIDPNTADPWPRHSHASGASIGLRAGVLAMIGGAPRVAFGEDRALIDRCRMIDLKIRHDPHIIMPVSGRLEGRAAGGMAETIKRRTQCQDEFTDAQLEPAVDAYRRSIAKAKFRACWDGLVPRDGLAAELSVHEDVTASAITSPYFGAAWDCIQTRSPALQRRRVAYAQLPHEINQALQLQARLYGSRQDASASAGTADISFIQAAS